MNWILEHIEVLVFVALVVGPMLKQVIESAKKQSAEARQREQPEACAPPDSEPEWIPVPTEIQEPAQQNPSPPPLPVIPSATVDAPSEPTMRMRQQASEPDKTRTESKRLEPKPSRVAGHGLVWTGHDQKPGNPSRTRVREQLAHATGLRTAFALREILGKPAGIR